VPVPPPEPDRAGRLVFVVSLLATLALVAGIARLWPEDDAPASVDTATSTTLMTAEVAEQAGPPVVGPEGEIGDGDTGPVTDLFGEDPSDAVQRVLEASHDPDRVIQLTIFRTYLFVAYVDPDQPDHIDRRMLREGTVEPASPNPIDDRVDADTTPKLFGLGEIDLARIPQLVADAPSHYDVPVSVTHIIIDRFLPFDERVLVRVYASPTDGRSGGGYVSYTADGTVVRVCC
jgi:hypothetical protein